MNYDMLNPEQIQAVKSNRSRILVLAGAGTGKTATLTSRMVRLYEDGVLPKEMLALTFTKAAGQEMKERVMKQIGPGAKDIFCNTFHAFAVQIVQKYAYLVGYQPFFTIYDEEDKKSVVEGIINDYQYKQKPDDVIEAMKNMYVRRIYPQGEMRHIIDEYNFQLKRDNALDFDMLLDKLKLLLMDRNVQDYIHSTYTHVFVDEFQDSDHRQLDILSRIDPENLFVVGDDFQSIYSFAGADVSIIMDIAEDPDYEVIKLERNYRSTQQIVYTANSLIKYNNQTEKVLKAERGGLPVTYISANDPEREAFHIAENIHRLLDDGKCTARDIAVLTRTNKKAEAMVEALQELAVPAELKTSVRSVLQTSDIKHIMNWMEAVVNPNNDRAVRDCLRWPKSMISRKELMQVEKYALEQNLSLLDGLRALEAGNRFIEVYDSIAVNDESATLQMLDIVGTLEIIKNYMDKKLDNRIRNFNNFKEILVDWELHAEVNGEDKSPLEWIRYYKLVEIDGMTEELQPENYVQVMTAHKAKGLEWDVVFVTGCNEKTFPLLRGDIEEERRICYVAVTRAKEKLFLTRPQTVTIWGNHTQDAEESRFIKEMGL